MIKPLAPNPAMLLMTRETRTLVVADLHVGWELALSNKGIHVPSQMPKILDRMTSLLSKYVPDRLLVLGDVKHTVATAGMGEWRDIPSFFDNLKKQVRDIWILRGNHDGNLDALLPEDIELLPAAGVTIDDVSFFHGHQWPSPALLKCKTLVMAHVHPVIGFRDPSGFRIVKQIWVKAKCDKTQLSKTLLQKHGLKIASSPEDTLMKHFNVKAQTRQLFIMPSFNEFLGGRPLNEEKAGRFRKGRMIVGPVLRSEGINLNDAEVFLVDGTFLGKLSQFMASDR